MNTFIQPTPILQDLAQWRPACEMPDDCGNAAVHALVCHGGCGVKFICGPCYRRFMVEFTDWLMSVPESHVVVCRECRGALNNPWTALHLEPL